MNKNKINTYSTKDFRDTFMENKQELLSILKKDFGKFFIVKVEEMFELIKLPIPPLRAINHSFIYLTSGEAIMKIGDKNYTIYKDQMLIVPAGQVFSFQNPDINTGYLCNFHNDILIGKYSNENIINEFDFLKIWGNPFIRLDKQSSEFILSIFKRLLIEYNENGIKKLDIIQPYLITLLSEINRNYKPLFEDNETKNLEITKKFMEVLFSNFKKIHLVKNYASLLFISPNHLNKCVKKTTGKSPTKWIDEILILEAKVLLYQSNYSISEVAFELGFYDQSYFSRFFKKYEGLTPLEFHKQIEIS